jgi:hypothetical protein
VVATVRAAALVVLGALVACGGGGDDTLQPLPIEGATVATDSTSVAEPPSPGSTTAPVATSTSVSAPIGGWDGARFDAGTITTLSTAGTSRTIGFDRYSFSDPAVGTIDADAFDEEPLAGWWRTSPFSNVRMQVRTFVLAPDVKVLVIDPAGRASACAGPPPASPPKPSWKTAGLEVLEDPAYVGAIATLTYSPTGQVARIRFTRGC